MAGYSENPLVKKLGIKPGGALYVYQAPAEYIEWLFPLPENISIQDKCKGELDFIHLFVKQQKEFHAEFLKGQKHLKKDGMMWISWPKKSANVATELDENIIRGYGLKAGLVDVKVCAVSEIWSGLKFVFRLKDR
jgi:hypothetical protein